ncbi:MAG: SPOR domain-containing protein [Halothiobacillaceae bacterium]|nr:SPOR domain-containing protein [Halothiobacillaceae bacterium]HUM98858.1 SPOR domain-containing protein [Halothiobacillus sp.]
MSELEPQTPTRGKLRQRLVGALVVVALAVLLLPLWLDGGGLKTPEVQPIPATPNISQPADIKVPAPTAAQLNELQNPPASALPIQEPKSPTAAPPSLPKATEQLAPTPLIKAPEPKTQVVKPAAIPAPESKPQSNTVPAALDSNTTPNKSALASPEPKKQSPAESNTQSSIEKPASTQANLPATHNEGEWVVQLGSFSDELNARGLAKSVSDSGFKVDVSPLFAKKGTVWRVRVGPYSTREQAVKTTIQLRERLGRDGLVMPK